MLVRGRPGVQDSARRRPRFSRPAPERPGSPEDPNQLVQAQFAYWRRPPLFEDAREFFSSISIPVCVVSNIDRADIEAAIKYHCLAFDHIVTSLTVGRGRQPGRVGAPGPLALAARWAGDRGLELWVGAGRRVGEPAAELR
jgi:hypothetical protein